MVFTETHIGGGGHVNIELPRPEAVRDFYKDIAVLAFPRPVGTERIRDLDYKNLSGRIRIIFSRIRSQCGARPLSEAEM